MTERRKYARFALQWPVRLGKASAWVADGTTRDISCAGFYVCSNEASIRVGDGLDCTIAVPAETSGQAGEPVYLACHVEVIRIEALHDGGRYGVGCRIQDYRVLREALHQPPADPPFSSMIHWRTESAGAGADGGPARFSFLQRVVDAVVLKTLGSLYRMAVVALRSLRRS